MPSIYTLIAISVLTGVTCGYLLCLGKQNAFIQQKFKMDRIISIIRYAIFITFLFTILQLKTTNSILLIVLLLLSYVGTVLFCIKKTG